jgi:uncharacterized protein (DUF1800 family)
MAPNPLPQNSPPIAPPIAPRFTATTARIRAATLFAAAGLAAGCAFGGGDPPGAATSPLAGVSAYALAERLTWGATATDVAAIRAQGAAAWVDRQLHPGPVPPLPGAAQEAIDAMEIEQNRIEPLVRGMEARRRAFEDAPGGGEREKLRKEWQDAMNGLAREAATRQLLRAVNAPDQLREQMTWFWMNHFSVFQHKHLNRALVGDYEQQLRGAALGSFRDLLGRSAGHAAMLSYLDNAQNAAGHLNENYARELLELHTLGVDGGYAQADVQELARVLSGLGVEAGEGGRGHAGALVVFRPRRHDAADKQLLGHRIRGRRDGELEEVLDLLAGHPATARHITRQLVRFWVGEAPQPALEQELALEFQRSRGEIAPVLRRLFDSPEFAASLGNRFKDPVHYVVSAVRLEAAGRVVRNATPMLAWINRMGEGYAGHSTPDGYPLSDADWSGPGQLAVRFEVARAIATGGAALFGAVAAPGSPANPASGQTADAFVREEVVPRLSTATREVLAQANSPREWSQFLLSAPEFMTH